MKALIVASILPFIDNFCRDNIDYLLSKGVEVHIAANCNPSNIKTAENISKFRAEYIEKGVIIHQIDFYRSPYNIKIFFAFRQLQDLINKERFNLIHCHTPVASVLTRIAARKHRNKQTNIIYTAHGFQFHKKSGIVPWLLYFPVEWLLSKYCDCLITINHEDFKVAEYLKCPNIRYIPGVGIDISKFTNVEINHDIIREQLGLEPSDIALLCIGEIQDRKNQEVLIRAISKLDNKKVKLLIAGEGKLRSYLQKKVKNLRCQDKVMFLGFRNDIPVLCKVVDIGVFPSRTEGLGMAGLEMLASGLPLISSNVHGIMDYNKNGVTGYCVDAMSVNAWTNAIEKLSVNSELRKRLGNNGRDAILPFGKAKAVPEMNKIYNEFL